MRAPRFPLNLPLSFRPNERESWQKTRTENISATGVLVRWPEPLPLGTALEFRLALPSRHPARGAAEVSGHGQVVRIVDAPTERPEAGFAIEIHGYNVRRDAEQVASPTRTLVGDMADFADVGLYRQRRRRSRK
jgi:hypothetical protein